PYGRRRGAALRTPEGARTAHRRLHWSRPAAHSAVDPLAPRASRDAADRVRQTRRGEPRIDLRVGDRPHTAAWTQRRSPTRSAEDGPPQRAQGDECGPPRKAPEGSPPLALREMPFASSSRPRQGVCLTASATAGGGATIFAALPRPATRVASGKSRGQCPAGRVARLSTSPAK